MSLFAIGDLHLSFGSAKPMDIFSGWENYEKRLEKNWRALVKAGDTVVIAGDLSWAMGLDGALKDFSFLHSLPGEKLLIKGNHDYWWSTKKKMESFFEENGFDTIKIIHNNAFKAGGVAVCGTRGWLLEEDGDGDRKLLLREAGRLKASIEAAKKLGGEPVVFLHYPPLSELAVSGELMTILKDEQVKRCYYGHLHAQATRKAVTGERGGITFSLVSSDYIGFCPKLVEKY